MQNNPSYSEILLEIDRLRAKGVADTDPQIKKLKVKLWSHLEKRNKKKSTKVVPTVTAIKTIKLDPKTLGKTNTTNTKASHQQKNPITQLASVQTSQLAGTLNNISGSPYTKYFLLGVVIAIAVICYKLFIKKD